MTLKHALHPVGACGTGEFKIALAATTSCIVLELHVTTLVMWHNAVVYQQSAPIILAAMPSAI